VTSASIATWTCCTAVGSADAPTLPAGVQGGERGELLGDRARGVIRLLPVNR
jgi:hypothetical protein